MPKVLKYKVSELDLNIDDIEKLAHLGGVMPSYEMFLKEELYALEDVLGIQGGYIITNSFAGNEEIQIEGITFTVGKDITKLMLGMEKAAIFLCTAGKEITERGNYFSERGDLVEAYLIDVLGSIIVEKAMDKVQQNLKTEMSKINLKITNRYSPGYCTWNVNEQHKLFSFFPDNFCKVKLNTSSLMEPVKSVSGIIGIGKELKYQKHICHSCNSRNCLYRSAKNT